MNKRVRLSGTILILMSVLLSGCLYPQDRLQQNQAPYRDQIAAVQEAVNAFREDSGGLLPIQTRDMETPIYQKYPVNFKQIAPRYIADPPGTAFESGGIYLYVLTDVEENPTVKLIDLRVAEKIQELKIRIEAYRQSKGYPPLKDVLGKNVLSLDYQKLGYKEPPQVKSPFTGQHLPFVMDRTGEIYVDYRLDLFQALQREEESFSEGDDIRDILVKNSPFVPAFSLPYTINEKNEPIFMAE
ncbi:hypothetical protein GJU40_02350 [Bacillus lacus]|uniref:ABC transporter periplasmic binding protein yphF n=1 Tax=Metabacillus lacus TaxID=1983721 RepID=A0A7X2IWL1_9BACI|nr:hypothetical protein [Metabacillus lacus]MRX71009.1 hypothetical protein [Metabacillus lacus]